MKKDNLLKDMRLSQTTHSKREIRSVPDFRKGTHRGTRARRLDHKILNGRLVFQSRLVGGLFRHRIGTNSVESKKESQSHGSLRKSSHVERSTIVGMAVLPSPSRLEGQQNTKSGVRKSSKEMVIPAPFVVREEALSMPIITHFFSQLFSNSSQSLLLKTPSLANHSGLQRMVAHSAFLVIKK